jgi:uncharacterized protein (DUF433 family)
MPTPMPRMPFGDYVVRALGVCGGRPTFKYTRIEITGTMERLAAGESLDAMVEGYGGRVSREAILEAVRVVTTQFLTTLPELEPVG